MNTESKVCAKCKISKSISSFNKRSKNVNSLRSFCKECCLKAEKQLYHNKANMQGRIVRLRRIHEVSEYQKHIEMLDRCRKYRKNNLEKKRASAREWAKRNKKKCLERFVERYNTDPTFNITIKLRRRIWSALYAAHNGSRKYDTFINLLGCSYNELKHHIESLFTDGMTWDLVISAKIHLDHIKPCSKFDLTKLSEQKECFHYSNLQPLWWKDNLIKGTTFESINLIKNP